MASSEQSQRWKELILKAKELYKKGKYEACLAAYREALAISRSEKLEKRIKQIEVSKSGLHRFVIVAVVYLLYLSIV